ncbi:4-coumarate--CoA ligase family protein [Streptacidiphilus sp. PB12-B1b]|uniref:AMP-binding protein n=1 Tax=Streptacidiphilus sp. PB12-B1b TaxID=2705012 RepID=UPI0015F85DF9|nr:AMP-binding protein [Streptacidiphilus sp. PB12-B1b]QMU78207.1 4-coumarate--CoA ligase family protein [Streptacidiphilus sp. PB12-B1b]
MVIRSPYPDITVPDTGLPAFLFGGLGSDAADGLADRPAVIDTDGRGYTYGQLATAVDRVAAALAERGAGRGDVAAIFAPNCPDYAVVFHGVLASGAVASPANALYTPAELAHQLRDSGARFLFTSAGCLDRARAAVAEDGVRVAEIIVLGPGEGAPGAVRETGFDELLASTAPSPEILIGGDDLAALPYSSGTTGLPKGVMLTHRNLVASMLQAKPLHRQDADSRVLAVLPLSHIYGITAIMNSALHHRSRIVTMPRFDLSGFLTAIEEHRIDHLYIAPPIALALRKSPLVDEHDLSSVRLVMSAAAPLDGEAARALAARMGTTVIQAYGLTESSPVLHGIPVDRPDLDRGSIGLLMPSLEARVVDPETGEDVPPGARGELWCRGPNIMRGYLNNPEATGETVDADGFLHTGDIVTVDADGAFHVVDRLKELIKYRGYQVAPAELEALLLTHDAVADAAVIGAQHDGEEVPKAFVVRHPAQPGLCAEEIQAFVAERIAPYKKIRLVEFLDRIPKSPAGKILRSELRERELTP